MPPRQHLQGLAQLTSSAKHVLKDYTIHQVQYFQALAQLPCSLKIFSKRFFHRISSVFARLDTT